jgi:hypothetical protein
LPKAKTNFIMLGGAHQAFYNSIPLIAAGDSITDKEHFENRLKFDIIIKFSLGTLVPRWRGNKRGWFLILVLRIIKHRKVLGGTH